MRDDDGQYGKWSHEEIRNAEFTARRFLQENGEQIAGTMRAKAKYLGALIERISHKDTPFEERLEFFARISEVARMIEEDADGFFELASQPVVAKILCTISEER
jgi:hypothetical protein